VVVQDGVVGTLGMPENLHLILPVAFIIWGLFFAAGGDNAAFGKVFLASIFGSVAALLTMPLAFETADFPDFWGIALWVGVFATILVLIMIFGDWYYVAGTFPCYAAVFLWWIATGFDGWVPGGRGDNTVVGLADPATAGTGAFGGLISTPWPWVWFSVWVTLVFGIVLGIVSAKVTAAIAPQPASEGDGG